WRLYTRPPAQRWPCQRSYSDGDAAGTTAHAGPGSAQEAHCRHSAVCGGAAVLCVSVLRDGYGLLAVICEELCSEPYLRLRQSCGGAVAGPLRRAQSGAWMTSLVLRLPMPPPAARDIANRV